MSEFKYLREKHCCVCNKRLDTIKKTLIRKVNSEDFLEKVRSVRITIQTQQKVPENVREIQLNDNICGRCRSYAKKYGSTLNQSSTSASNQSNYSTFNQPNTSAHDQLNLTCSSLQNEQDQDVKLKLNIPRTLKSDSSCIICRKTKNLVKIPDLAYVETFINKNIMIPDGAKCYGSHLNRKNNIHKRDLDKIEIVSDNIELSGSEVQVIFTRLQHLTKLTNFERFANETKLNENDCISYTGFTKDEFSTILQSLKLLKPSPARNKSQALATYLFWLKTGLDNRTIATIFSLDNHQSVSEYCQQVRNSMMKDFVPKNLGAKHLPRNVWTSQTCTSSKLLFSIPNNQLAFIADGTYIYTHKSMYKTIQRKGFSGQKKRHLVKPFVICSTTGKIVDIYGYFPATDNDAKILSNILASNDQNCRDLRDILQAGDHIFLDRGFRDVISELQTKYKLKTHSPACLQPNQKQLDTFEANTSRFVTKCRWPIEVLNGHLKTRFRANDKTHYNVELKHGMEDLRISASLINKFSKGFISKDIDRTIAEKMITKLNIPNRLETIITEKNLAKKELFGEKWITIQFQISPNLILTRLLITSLSENTNSNKHSLIFMRILMTKVENLLKFWMKNQVFLMKTQFFCEQEFNQGIRMQQYIILTSHILIKKMKSKTRIAHARLVSALLALVRIAPVSFIF